MAQAFYGLLTAIGEAKDANAKALGIPMTFSEMAVGDGGGIVPVPDKSRKSLIRQVRRAPLNSLVRDTVNTNQVIAEQVIPETEGGWYIRELGLYDADGDLVAIANCPETYKPQLAEGSGRVQTVRMVLIVSSASNVVLKIDPAIILATREYADNKAIEVVTAHEAKADPHPQYWNDLRGNPKLELKAPLDSPAFTGLPLVPTAALGVNTGQIASTEFVQTAIAPKATIVQAQSGSLSYAIDAGIANTYTVALSPAITAYTDGIKIRFRALTKNTGASTLNVSGLGAVGLLGSAHAALAGGEIIAGGYCEAQYNGSLSKFVLLECTGGAQQIANATASQHSVALNQLSAAKNFGVAKIMTSGNFTTPANINNSTVFKFTLVGGGGGGGGASGASTSAGGGGAGAAATFLISGLAPGTSYPVVIGALGAGGAVGSTGGTGGTTQITIGATVYSCAGGIGGVGATAQQARINSAQGATSATITALATYIGIYQTNSNPGWGNDPFFAGSNGAGLPFGSNGSAGYTSAVALSASGFGAGGGGGVLNQTGGNGAPGMFISEWVA